MKQSQLNSIRRSYSRREQDNMWNIMWKCGLWKDYQKSKYSSLKRYFLYRLKIDTFKYKWKMTDEEISDEVKKAKDAYCKLIEGTR